MHWVVVVVVVVTQYSVVVVAGEPEKVKAGWLKLQPHPTKKIAIKGGINVTVKVETVSYAAKSNKEVDNLVMTKMKSS
jgi:hypothetical protein